jgi:glutamate/tyrosine decarboxylase-like PLP-dependent enzyme
MIVDTIQDHFVRVQSEIASGPVLPNVTAEEIRTYLSSRYDFQKTMSLDEVVADVEEMLRTWQVQVTHPRYFGLFNPSVTLASVVADTLVAMYNSQLANWRTSPAANEIERHTLGWLSAKFGLPADSIATFTSGGMEANLSAIVAALTRAFPEYGEEGLRRLPAEPTIYLTHEAHHGYNKIAHMTGLGRRSLRMVATDCDLKMDLADLTRQIAADLSNGFAPFMVVATAGTTATGVIDPLPEISRLCKEENLWLHVDAAWGGSAILSPRLRHLLAGIETADSITCDAHKWLSVPMGAGMFFCRHAETVAEAFRAEVSYMLGKKVGPVFDPYTNSAQWSRRFIGLKLFMALANNGERGYIEMIEHQTEMGDLLREELRQSGWRIVNSTPLPLICFTRNGLDTAKFLAELHRRQVAWMSPAEIAGEPVVRACVTSYLTAETDIRWVVNTMNDIAEEQLGKPIAAPVAAVIEEPIGVSA